MSALAVSITKVTPDNGSGNGTATIAVSGGIEPYSYLWSDGATVKDRQGLVNGTYFLTIGDQTNPICTYEINISFGNDHLGSKFISITVEDITYDIEGDVDLSDESTIQAFLDSLDLGTITYTYTAGVSSFSVVIETTESHVFNFITIFDALTSDNIDVKFGAHGCIPNPPKELGIAVVIPTVYDAYLETIRCCFKSKAVCALNFLENGNVREYWVERNTALVILDIYNLLASSTWNETTQCLSNEEMQTLLNKVSLCCGCPPAQFIPSSVDCVRVLEDGTTLRTLEDTGRRLMEKC